MATLKLTYFDFHGGRGGPARLALSMAGVPFEDDRIGYEAWPALKDTTPFGALPVLKVDGQALSQSNAITRYVGKLTNLYPTDPWQAALCDEAMDAVEDVIAEIVTTMSLPDEEKKAKRQALAEGPIPFHLTRLQQKLEAQGGLYFADNRLTIADLKVAMLVRQLRSGVLDHVPTNLPDRKAPRLIEHYDRVMNDPGVKAYYERMGVTV